MVSANGTVVNHNVPCPESYCIPLERGEKKEEEKHNFHSIYSIRQFTYFLKISFISEMEKLGYFKKSFISRVILSHELRSVAGTQWYIPFTHTSRTQLQNQVPPPVAPFLFFVKQSQASTFLFEMYRQGCSSCHILSCDGKDRTSEKGPLRCHFVTRNFRYLHQFFQ